MAESSAMVDEAATDLAVELVLAMMSSASTDEIRALDWWPRARTALETGAAVASTWAELISKMSKKLQIVTLSKSTADRVTRVGEALIDPGDFRRFKRLAKRDAVYIVAMAQARRDEEKKARKA